MEIELKPCPFCGKEAIAKEYEDASGCSKVTTSWAIGCHLSDCHAEIDVDMAYYKTEQEAIEAWNTRT